MTEFLGSRGGQLAGAYLLFVTLLAASGFKLIDAETGKTLMNIVIGAIIRDMQDGMK